VDGEGATVSAQLPTVIIAVVSIAVVSKSHSGYSCGACWKLASERRQLNASSAARAHAAPCSLPG